MQSTALEFGVINTLRTGHAVYDLMICMTVPAVIQAVTTSGKDSVEMLRSARETVANLLFRKQFVTHTIETAEHSGTNGKLWRAASDVCGNELLQKAILQYLSEYVALDKTNGRCELIERPDAPQTLATDEHIRNLEPDKQKQLLALLQQQIDPRKRNSNSKSNSSSEVPDIAKLRATPLPMRNEWVPIGDGVEFMNETITKDLDKSSNVTERKVLFHLRARGADAPKRIDAFVHRAFEAYRVAENRKFSDDTARYMYVRSFDRPLSSSEDTDDDERKRSAPFHKRYALGDTKTFANVFFPAKPQLLTLLDHFGNKTGKFAVHGFPNKLGLLLFGPPGTGKTSLIKAIAHHTKRHIVNISLGKIHTNQELMDAMFDLHFAVDGLDLPVRLGFKDVVFVMEDIDCATTVVASRETGSAGTTHTNAQGKQASEATSPSPSVHEHHEEQDKQKDDGSDATVNNDNDAVDDDEPESDPESTSSKTLKRDNAGANNNNNSNNNNGSGDDVDAFDDDFLDDDDDEDAFLDMDTMFGGGGGGASSLLAAFLQAQQTEAFATTGNRGFGSQAAFGGSKAKRGFVASSNSSDRLNLAGVLNVLDGVIDCPGRIVIMTTNHPEKLDPALIRPGRISKKLHLGYMASAEICEMLEYYFATPLSVVQNEQLHAMLASRAATKRRGLSPAFIEELCAEFDDIDDVLRQIASA